MTVPLFQQNLSNSNLPLILAQPSNATVYVGSTANFSVETSLGSEFQWLLNGTPIAGATTSIYTTPSAIADDDSSLFSVMVTNSSGSTLSASALLSVLSSGTQLDIVSRLQALIPYGWFTRGGSPLKDALLTGMANMFAFAFQLFGYVKQQTRILTATDGFLDLIAADFFGGNLIRRQGQSDTSFRSNILAFMFRERVTRQSIVNVIEQLLGTTPSIIEPDNPNDTGVYNVNGAGTIGYGVAGVYGSMMMPFQPFVTVFKPLSSAIAPPQVAGYGIPTGAYATPSQIEYITYGADTFGILDTDIYAALNSVRPVDGVIWTQILPVA